MSTYVGDPRTGLVLKDGHALSVHHGELNLSNKFDWGITGPSSTQLGLAILAAEGVGMQQATLLAQQFAVVALVRDLKHGEPFTITSERIREYITEAQATKPAIHYRSRPKPSRPADRKPS